MLPIDYFYCFEKCQFWRGKRHWCRYLMISSIGFIWSALMAVLLSVLCLVWVLFYFCVNGITHNPVNDSLVPLHTAFPL